MGLPAVPIFLSELSTYVYKVFISQGSQQGALKSALTSSRNYWFLNIRYYVGGFGAYQRSHYYLHVLKRKSFREYWVAGLGTCCRQTVGCELQATGYIYQCIYNASA